MLESRQPRGPVAVSQAIDAEFRRFFDEHFADVRSYCLRRLPVADANDAVSEVFLVAWRKRSEVPAEARPWLFAIARNVVRNHARSSVRIRRLRSRLGVEPSYPEPGPEVQVVRNADDEALLRAVQTLPDKYGEVVRLWAWEWLTAKEIAEVVGISAAAAEKRLTRALKQLRAKLATQESHAIRPEAQQ